MRKIDLIIIGAQKAGTSSLNKYLATHPDFITHENLEFTYFVNDEVYANGYQNSFAEHYTHFKSERIIAKSVGVLYEEEALLRLKDHNPNVKIVVTVRNPVDRAYSAYWYARRMGWEKTETFEESISSHGENHEHWIGNRFCEYVKRSEYVTFLRMVFKHFDRNQVYVVLAEDLRENAEEMCNKIMTYFGYSPRVKLKTEKEYNRSALPRYPFVVNLLTDRNPIKKYIKKILPVMLGRKIKNRIRSLNEKAFAPPKISPETRIQLVEYFKPFNLELGELINKDLTHWNA